MKSPTMQKHLEEVLTTAGLSPEQVKALSELPDDAKDFKTDDYIAPIRTGIETAVKNDPEFYKTLNKQNLPPEFVKSIEAEQYGRAANITRNHIFKGLGLSEKEFESLGEEGKRLEVLIPAVVKKFSEGKINDKQLQEKLVEVTTELDKLRGQEPEIETKYKSKYEQQLNTDKQEFIVFAELATVPNLKAPPKYIADKVNAKLNEKFAVIVAGNEAVIRQKSNPDLKVLINNKDELTLRGAIEAILEADNLIDRTEGGKKTTVVSGTTVDIDGTKGGLIIPSHVNDKIQKKIAAEKAAQK